MYDAAYVAFMKKKIFIHVCYEEALKKVCTKKNIPLTKKTHNIHLSLYSLSMFLCPQGNCCVTNRLV